MRRSLWMFFVALSACVDTSTGPGLTGRVRLVNVITDSGRLPVDVLLDLEAFGDSLEFGESVPAALPPPQTALYTTLPWGGHNFTLRQSADSDLVVGQYTFAIEASDDITLYATGSGGFTGGVAAADRAANVVVNLNNQIWPGGGRTIVIVDAENFLFARGVVLTDQ